MFCTPANLYAAVLGQIISEDLGQNNSEDYTPKPLLLGASAAGNYFLRSICES